MKMSRKRCLERRYAKRTEGKGYRSERETPMKLSHLDILPCAGIQSQMTLRLVEIERLSVQNAGAMIHLLNGIYSCAGGGRLSYILSCSGM